MLHDKKKKKQKRKKSYENRQSVTLRVRVCLFVSDVNIFVLSPQSELTI